MKKLLLIPVIFSLLSCFNQSEVQEVSFDDVKYYTENSRKPGTYIRESIDSDNNFMVLYPDYASESYDALKFIIALISLDIEVQVVLETLPDKNNRSIEDMIREDAPLLGFQEMIDLYNFLELNKIDFNNQITGEKRVIHLIPESSYKEPPVGNYTKIVVSGSGFTPESQSIISKLPASKRVSSVPLRDGDFDIIILNGEVINYSSVELLDLYNSDNFNDAPAEFIEDNSFPIESVQIARMNNVLKKKVSKSYFLTISKSTEK